MTNNEFKIILEETISHIQSVLTVKADEYARGGDRLSLFKRAARIAGSTPETALIGMFMKHLVSILDMVDNIRDSYVKKEKDVKVYTTTKIFDLNFWNEKIGDAINYLILLKALVKERINYNNDPDFFK